MAYDDKEVNNKQERKNSACTQEEVEGLFQLSQEREQLEWHDVGK
jgi:hypothetical protein